MTESDADRLRRALVAAYRPHVEDIVEQRGLPAVPDAVANGERWLDEALAELLSMPFSEQARSPLEVFQAAMRFPTEALDSAGVAPVPRDETAEAALPGDRYDLAPASSQVLGEEAWKAHLVWGAAKAAGMRPLAVAFTRNLLDVGRLEAAAAAAGYRLDRVERPDALPERAFVAFIDLEHPDADEAVRALAASAGWVIAYGPHVDDVAMLRARSLGADDALPRSRFFRDTRAMFPDVV